MTHLSLCIGGVKTTLVGIEFDDLLNLILHEGLLVVPGAYVPGLEGAVIGTGVEGIVEYCEGEDVDGMRLPGGNQLQLGCPDLQPQIERSHSGQKHGGATYWLLRRESSDRAPPLPFLLLYI